MERYLIDTNVVPDYLSASLPDKGMKLMDTAIDATPHISVITQIELLCWKPNEQTEQYVKDFISDSLVYNISQDVVTQCVTLRRNKKNKNTRCHNSCYCTRSWFLHYH